MPTDCSVRSWMDALHRGDEDAAQRLWEQYFQRLVDLARKKLQDVSRGAADEEDVALSALNSFFSAVRQRGFPRVSERDDLWRLLVVFTVRKAAHVRRDARRLKRGGGIVGPRPGGHSRPPADELLDLDDVADGEPTPELAAIFAEEVEQRLKSLADESLREVALLTLHGYSGPEIAARLNCVPRTVQRKLAVIRRLWEGPA